MCAAIAIIKALLTKRPVFIICKNEHLALRDQKKHQALFGSFQLNTYLNNYTDSPGVYYLTEKYLDQAKKKD
jgi:preprotein translocase subunit SecA